MPLQFVSHLPATPHPQLATIKADIQHVQERFGFITITPMEKQKSGHVVGEGHCYQVIVHPPSDCKYGFSPPLTLHLSLPTPYNTYAIPALRVSSHFEHSQVREDGFLDPKLVRYNRGLQQSLPPPTSNSPIVGVLQLFSTMLESCVPEPATELDTLDLQQLLQLWKEHDPKCTCIVNQAMPCPWSEAAILSQDELQLQLKNFYANVKERHQVLYDTARLQFKRRLANIQEWQQRTTRPELYNTTTGWQEEWFHPAFWHALHQPDKVSAIQSLADVVAPGVYAFDMFTSQFCDIFATELAAYESSNLLKSRPNSMNRYGMILLELGMSDMLMQLMTVYLQPVVRALMPDLAEGMPMDHHHTFVVHYQHGQDLDLDMHTDDSEFTCNINLVDTFTGCGLSFCGMHGSESHRKLRHVYQHQRGRAVVHAGMHRHGADELVSGRRENLIIWCRSSGYRQSDDFHGRFKQQFLTEEAPDQRCLSRTHDRDYQQWTAAFKAGKQDKSQLALKQD
eukprot:m.35289 g.35289  ORF g.35289 m.35289 type:complete len:509 (+) comp12378_c0_seq1:183-1709(+)